MLWECKAKTLCVCFGAFVLGIGTYRTGCQDWTVMLANDDMVPATLPLDENGQRIHKA
jgi:hypothetical protein